MICAPTTDNATWCLTPASCSAERRFVVVVVKKCITGSSSNNGESATSTRTSAAATVSARPSPVNESTPDRREAVITSCPCALSLDATFEPISPRPPMTTIFMMNLSELRSTEYFGCSRLGHGGQPVSRGHRLGDRNFEPYGLLSKGLTGVFQAETFA